MPRKRHKAEEIVAKLRQVEVLSGQGQSAAEAIRSIGVTSARDNQHLLSPLLIPCSRQDPQGHQ